MKKVIRVSILLSIFSMGCLSIVDASCPNGQSSKRKLVIVRPSYTITQCPSDGGPDECCVPEVECVD